MIVPSIAKSRLRRHSRAVLKRADYSTRAYINATTNPPAQLTFLLPFACKQHNQIPHTRAFDQPNSSTLRVAHPDRFAHSLQNPESGAARRCRAVCRAPRPLRPRPRSESLLPLHLYPSIPPTRPLHSIPPPTRPTSANPRHRRATRQVPTKAAHRPRQSPPEGQERCHHTCRKRLAALVWD